MNQSESFKTITSVHYPTHSEYCRAHCALIYHLPSVYSEVGCFSESCGL